MQDQLQAYFIEHRDHHLEELKQFLRIPSVSALPEHAGDMRICTEWTADALRQAGCEHIQIIPTEGHSVSTRTGCTRRASPPFSCMAITTSSLQIRWSCGKRPRSSQR
jgi:acetylornithine deacetylase/succinyl-diaminopimelate desuccinylase-like protein